MKLFCVCWDWAGDLRFDLGCCLCMLGLRRVFDICVGKYVYVCVLGWRLDIYFEIVFVFVWWVWAGDWKCIWEISLGALVLGWGLDVYFRSV